MGRVLAAAVSALMLGACASIPDATMTYYHAETMMDARVTAIVSCPEGGRVHVSLVPVIETSHRADLDSRGYFETGSVTGPGNDNTLGFQFFGDGRLKGVNASSKGRGQAIVEAALEILPIPGIKDQREPDACAFIAREDPKSRTVTVVLTASLIPQTDPPASASFNPLPTSRMHYEELESSIGALVLALSDVRALDAPVRAGSLGEAGAMHERAVLPCPTGEACLELRHPAMVSATIRRDGEDLSSSRILVSQLGSTYGVPVPKGALFGNTEFVLALDESGTLTNLTYGATDGSSSALGALASTGDALVQSDEERLAALKLESDLIVQEQRRAACRTNPQSCQ
ncbi:hypothetical protein E3U23_07470 [Erythrobacter litoralis]|uniref:hypothetical protein n=1 Tax=Erythrobacter litoralis TaxID=39960 RepID=UPI0024352B30|nr:hypothetical protein [Erythrobacter litoralis]MDG6079029.1 hypothetical protein [Erythrobacter litoralis]